MDLQCLYPKWEAGDVGEQCISRKKSHLPRVLFRDRLVASSQCVPAPCVATTMMESRGWPRVHKHGYTLVVGQSSAGQGPAMAFTMRSRNKKEHVPTNDKW